MAEEATIEKTKKSVQLKFKVQDQQELLWCWSAVGTSVALFYDENSGWTQCKMASECLEPAPGNCCIVSVDADGKNVRAVGCAEDWYLINGDKSKGSFVRAGIGENYVKGAISYEEVKKEVDAGHPIGFRMKIGAFYHFVLVCGYEETEHEQFVAVEDSFYDDTTHMLYTDFCTKYQHRGVVTYTFFSHPPKK